MEDKKIKSVWPGDVVTAEGQTYTVYGIMVGDNLPSEEQVREFLSPFYPDTGDGPLMVCTFGDIEGYEAPKDGKYGNDSIFWGT